MAAALLSFVALFAMIAIRVPIAVALMATGVAGYWALVGLKPMLGMVSITVWDFSFSYTLSAIPLFVLMGNIVARSGIAEDLFGAAELWLARFKGGLAVATVSACAGFGAICGSSAATAATMSRVALPSMRRRGYDDGLSAATVAAGGTLGILIPPSILLLTYGIFTQTHIGKLFAAGIIPGLIGVAGYIVAIRWVTWRTPGSAPDITDRPDIGTRLRGLFRIWPVLALFVLVMGGIYGGFMTSTEASGIGAAGALVLAAARKGFGWRKFRLVLWESGILSATIFAIILGAAVYTEFLNQSGIHTTLISAITGSSIPGWGVILIIIGIYIVLGCVLESVALVLLTIPLFFPVVMALGYDPVWFGILLVLVTELGLITPPIGLNLFIIQAAAGNIRLGTIIRGIVPFIVLDVIRVLIIAFIPALSLWLPGILF
ncbi:TRAP transporter large permease [Mesobacterium pallidum]|uniref:TRAP transporter large permease n=1 Tax=Mesobacterium pallidum TaxID=2872037 RepID=UPI001EE2F052|nr:TRAP transporter large permease [Mesobacterium pallidum]